MTQSCEVIPMGSGVQAANQQAVSNQAALFISNELLPMMASFFPKSAQQINGNLVGHAISYGMMLKGIPVGVIRGSVCDLAEKEPDGFAPEPQKLKRLCMLAMDGDQPNGHKLEISIRSLEMRAQVMALNGFISDSEVVGEVETLKASYEAKGFEVTGRVF